MRVTGWQVGFAQLLAEAQTRSFRWGVWDCCIFGARDVAVNTGRDPRSVFPPYQTRREAEHILVAHGGIEGLISHALDCDPVPRSRAVPGDIVTADFGRGLAAAVCRGVDCVAPARLGLVALPMSAAVNVWSL